MPRITLLALARQSLRHHHPGYPTTAITYRRHRQRPFSMSSATQYAAVPSPPKDESDAAASATGQQKQQQGLPAPGEGTPVTLDVSGEGSTVKLAELGPLVVNVDGTVARITNWKEMTEAERETTVRMVGRRNKQRLEALKKQKEEGGQ